MEAMGRGFSDLFRNSSEELILKSLMENPVGISSAPSLEMLGLKNMSHSLRADSEELFNTWLMNGETSLGLRTRQASRRLSKELSLPNQQNMVTLQRSVDGESFQQKSSTFMDKTNECYQPIRNIADAGMQASNLYLAKAWFHSTQPMTRSRSSELRRRYAAMQNLQMSSLIDAPDVTQNFTPRLDASPSSTTTTAADAVSSVVSMLKDTLERKKLGKQADVEILESNSFGLCESQEVPPNITSMQDAAHQIGETIQTFPGQSTLQLKDSLMSEAEASFRMSIEGYSLPSNQSQIFGASQELSQLEAAPVISTSFDFCYDQPVSAQTITISESFKKQMGNATPEHEPKSRDFAEKIFESNFKNEQKRGNLVRMGSISSVGSVDKGDPTKKRRVERSRKMAEAKEKSSIQTLPSDMQSVLKRCENLEKEVRSLKLNLSFMNRKDSEQTKQIEDLQKETKELTEEKKRLLEVMERMLSESGEM